MEVLNPTWSYDQFKAYLLIFAAESNQIITEEEKDYIVELKGKPVTNID